jgi:3'(2'), 5'-bisphosphate nucleotidase
MSPVQPDDLAEVLQGAADAAGAAILALYGTAAGARLKADRTPITEADLAADRMIAIRLGDRFPEIPLISEESVGDRQGPPAAARRYFLVDPLDGTREFIGRTDEFTVNIGLIQDGRPVAGIVHAPVLGESYIAVGGTAYWFVRGERRGPLRARRPMSQGTVILVSRFHRDEKTDAFIAAQRAASVVTTGSALKFGVLARGDADLYPRYGRTMEWDTAAGHAVLSAAGGSVRTLDGADLRYGKPGFANPAFLARGLD